MIMKYKLFIVTNQNIALLKGSNGRIYLSKPPYKSCEEINHNEYITIAYTGAGTVYPNEEKFKSLKEIGAIIESK